MDADNSFLPDKLDMDPNMTDRLQQQQHQQHIVVLDEGAPSTYSRVSPPKAVIDSSPLQSAMDKNKESLKVKLLVRRSFDQLVQQGIMPPLKTSPAIYEQRRQLERAKTGDLLKAKIKKRPDRVELEQRHILEHCDSHIDPSLAEKRRMLEKALLVDHLNSKISHRPGPLDLIGKNILHADEPIERIVKEGLVDYTSTLDDASVATPTTVGEGEDSLSSEGESLQGVAVALVAGQHDQQVALLPHTATIQLPTVVAPSPPTLPATQILTVPADHFINLEPAIPIVGNDGTLLATIATQLVTPTTTSLATVATVAAVPLAPKEKSRAPAIALRSILPNAKPAGEVNPTPLTLSMTIPSIAADLKHHLSSSSNSVSSSTTGGCSAGPGTGIGGGKDKSSKKKCKSKTITKARSIKFHEYKGPSGSHKSSSGSGGGGSLSSDNNYQLIMKQQHLLEYLEEMCKKPTGIPSPSSSSSNRDQIATDGDTDTAGTGPDLTPIDSPLGSQSGAATPARSKTSTGGNTGGATSGTDLSTDALNKYKVSQLKKYCKQYNLPVSGTKSNLIERLRAFVKTADVPGGSFHIVSTTPVADTGGENLELEDNLLAEQQKRIAELQLQLKRSQEELEQFRSMCTNQFAAPGALDAGPTVPIPPPPPPPPPQCPIGSPSVSNRHHLGDVLVAPSPFSIAADSPIGGDGGGNMADSTGTGDLGGPVVSTVLEAGFFLGGLSTADSTTVDYGHEMEDIMHAELTTTTAAPTVTSVTHSVERSPTHHAMLDKVLGQVQPTISGLTMPDPVVEDRGLVVPQVGGVVSVVPPIGDMHDLSLSMKSVKFEAPPDTGDDSMQQDSIMLNDFGDIDLVDFQMHSLDSDGPFPMITNHDPMPVTSSTTEHHHQHMHHHHHHQQQQQQQLPVAHQQHASPSSTATHGTLSLFGVQNDPSGIKLLSNSFHDHLHSSGGPGVVDVLQPQTYINNNDILSIDDDSDALGLLEQDDRQIGLTAPNSMKLFQQHPHLHHQHQHHHQREQQLHQQQSDSNNNRNNSFGANSSIGSFRFALQQQQQPIASSSSSSASSSPGNCFKSPAVPGQQLTANNTNLSKPQTTLILTPTNHDHQHQHQQQQLHPNHHPHQQLLQQQQAHDQLGQTSAAGGSSNGTLMGEDIESFQDNAMDFESLLTNDETEADGVLTANTCHRMMLDCAQDKPMFSFLPETSILDYFNEDCNGHDYEIKHLEY